MSGMGRRLRFRLRRSRPSRWNYLLEQSMSDTDFMRLAIKKTRDGIHAGQSPFGSLIVKDQEVIAVTHNTVWQTTDPTAHAEVNCIRAAAKALDTIFLHGCTLY